MDYQKGMDQSELSVNTAEEDTRDDRRTCPPIPPPPIPRWAATGCRARGWWAALWHRQPGSC